jgi:hypothetical protein
MTSVTPPRFATPRYSLTQARVAEEQPTKNHRRDRAVGSVSTRHCLPSRNARNLLKTNDRATLYSTLNRGVSIPCLLASLTHCLRITRHTMQSKFRSISLKTKESDPRKVTHKSDHLSFRTTDSLRTRSLPYRPLGAGPCYAYLVIRQILSGL